MEVRQVRNRGFSLMQVLVASGLAMIITFLLAQTSLFSTQSFTKLQNQGQAVSESRVTVERLVQDIKTGDKLLCKYPVTSSPAFTAADDSTIIIRQPIYDSSNEPIADQYRVVIYQVATTGVAAEGPKVLKRFTATINGTNQSNATFDKVVMKNVVTHTMLTSINQIFWGDQSTKEYWLLSTPKVATADVKNEFLIGGVDRFSDGKATRTGNKVTLTQALQHGVIADATYRSDPTTSVDLSGDNGGTSVFLRFVVRPQWKTQNGGNKTKDVTYTSRPSLLNRES